MKKLQFFKQLFTVKCKLVKYLAKFEKDISEKDVSGHIFKSIIYYRVLEPYKYFSKLIRLWKFTNTERSESSYNLLVKFYKKKFRNRSGIQKWIIDN